MVVNDILKPRKEVVDSKINFQYALKAYKVNSHDEDRLESTPERFFETTYPSNAIRNMISVVNDKLIGEDHQGGIVLSGSYGSGKTHALVTIYNLFKHPELAEEWIKYHNIKFNTESLKSDNNVCMLSTSEIDPDYLWKPIFSTLGFSNLLEEVKRYPTISTIEKIIGKGKTAIFIDELERWYGSIDSEEDQELLEANKMFLQNLLEVASENENLFVFIGFLEENRDLKEIINRINPRKEDMASTGDREKIIIHRLFETTKEDVDTTKIASVINEYIDEYNKSDIYFENTEKYIELMIRHYPFHPQLIEVLDDIYDSASESQNVRGEMQVLADLVKNNYLDKDLFLISDLDVRPLQSIDYIITNRYTSDKAECQKQNLSYSKEVLASILLFTIDERKGVAEKSDILLSVLRKNYINQIDVEVTLDKLLGTAHYLHKKSSGFLIKDERNIFALINSNAEKINDNDAKEELANYIRKNFFDSSYKIYNKDEIEDNSKTKYVLLLEAPSNKKELRNFLNDNLYYGRMYRNTLVIIKPNDDIYKNKYLNKIKRIIAIKQLREDLNKEREKIEQVLRDEKDEINREIRNAFGRYLRWGYYDDELFLRQESVDASADIINDKIKSDISEIKDYILEQVIGNETGIIAEDLLEDCKKYRKYPFISNDHVFYNALKQLYNEKRVFIEGDNNKIYRNEFINIQGRMSVLDPDYYPEASDTEEENDDKGFGSDIDTDIGKDTDSENEGDDSQVTQVKETEAIEKETQGNSKRVLFSNLETQLSSKVKINQININIEIDGNYTKDELKELLMSLPDAEGKYSLEIIGERDLE